MHRLRFVAVSAAAVAIIGLGNASDGFAACDFGTAQNLSRNTTYTAASPGIVVAYATFNGSCMTIDGTRNGSIIDSDAGALGDYGGVTFPVKQGETWRVNGGTCVSRVTFTDLSCSGLANPMTSDLDMGGHNVTNTGAYFHSSDNQLKTGITPVSGLDIIEHLTGVSFHWKKDGKPAMGVIAQEVEKVMPQAVMTDEKTGIKSVEYDQLLAPTIQAIKELNAKIEALDEDNRALREQMRDLKPQLPQEAGSR